MLLNGVLVDHILFLSMEVAHAKQEKFKLWDYVQLQDEIYDYGYFIPIYFFIISYQP